MDIDGDASASRGPTRHRRAGIDRLRILEREAGWTRDESDRGRFQWRGNTRALEEKCKSGRSLYTRARTRRDREGWSLCIVPTRSADWPDRLFSLRTDTQTDPGNVARNRYACLRSARYWLPQLHLHQHHGKMHGSSDGKWDSIRRPGST